MLRVSERSGPVIVVEGTSASVKWVADRGHRNAAPKVEEELSGVAGDQGVPGKAGGRVEDPGETGDPAEGSGG